MNLFPLKPHTLFVCLAGSHAHGTAQADSDLDIRGVCIAPLPVRVSFRCLFEQHEGALDEDLWQACLPTLQTHPTAAGALGGKIESVVYDLAKLLRLCAHANPNCLEILFADPRDWILASPAWQRLWKERHRFLSLQVQQTYLGYALAQLKKIRTHRAWLLEPPKAKPRRADFGLPDHGTLGPDDRQTIEAGVAARLRDWGLEDLELPKATRIALRARMQAFWGELLRVEEDGLEARMQGIAEASLGLGRPLRALLQAERRYRSALRHWDAYQAWTEERNPLRAGLEARFGYDTKHAMHLVRLMRTGLELLETGELRVRREDAADLLAIRNGSLTYAALLGEAEKLQARMAEAGGRSGLPREVDQAALDELLIELIRGAGL